MSYIDVPRRAFFVRWLLIAIVGLGVAAGPGWVGTAFAGDHGPRQEPLQTTGQGQGQEEQGSDPEANLPYLFAVYIVTWAAFFGYVFVMSRRRKEMQREIEALRMELAEREGASSRSKPAPTGQQTQPEEKDVASGRT